MTHATLAMNVAGVTFQNPVLLAAGTAAYGRELAGVLDPDRLGGIVTKAVSLAPRPGAPAPRVAELDEGMINAVGLANPGAQSVRDAALPWLAANLRRARVLVNVVGSAVEEFAEVIRILDESDGISGYELNVSCPNVRAGGLEFGADAATLAAVVAAARSATRRALFVKLSPTLPDIAASARTAADAGADGITLVNTIPGLAIDVEARRPRLGFGSGGVSGAALLPVGVLATWKVRSAVKLPLIGVGGIATAGHALQYMLAGASLVAMGTAAMRDPRAPERVVRELSAWCATHNVRSVAEIVGSLEWPS